MQRDSDVPETVFFFMELSVEIDNTLISVAGKANTQLSDVFEFSHILFSLVLPSTEITLSMFAGNNKSLLP